METKTEYCPLIREACIKEKCKRWVHIQGQHPQSGEPIDLWDCTDAWMPVLLIKFSQEVRQAAAATESMRNDAITRIDSLRALGGLIADKRNGS